MRPRRDSREDLGTNLVLFSLNDSGDEVIEGF